MLRDGRRLAQLCGQVTRYARLAGIVQADAASGLTEVLTPSTVRHHATITNPKEIGALLRAIDDYPGEVVTRCVLKFSHLSLSSAGRALGLNRP